MQDSDGAAISSAPSNAAPNQELDLELEFGDENIDSTSFGLEDGRIY
ncbi:MAG: hypothetical protein WBX01_04535 [Nitrososphaeraceae archaeon]